MYPGYATAEGTARYAARFAQTKGFYRTAQELCCSTLGIGSYLGAMDEATDRAYAEAVAMAVSNGINFIDTSLNYRHQHSELAIGAALAGLMEAGKAQRDEVVLCTKAGYLVPDAVPLGVLRQTDIVGNMHSMAPAFLRDQLERSRRNLGVETVDVFYLHNPETQLRYMDEGEFYRRIGEAFVELEAQAAAGTIRYYGTATWEGYRKADGLSLERMVQMAEAAGGAGHHFRFIQLPLNLAMLEGMKVLRTVGELGVTAIASATLLQSRLASGLPEGLVDALAPASSDAARAIQFTRSAPGITTALVGMSQAGHVAANLEVAGFAPLTAEQFAGLFEK